MWKRLTVFVALANAFLITRAYEQCSGPHEYYDSCAQTCPPQTCESIGRIYECPIQAAVCKGACRCEKGYYRNKLGECISQAECEQCKGPHEYYDTCAPTCPPQTCESIGKTYHCPLQPAVCKGSCRCEEGYYRNKIGECISKKECKKCCHPHEYFSCGSACDNVCATLNTRNQTHCPIVNIKCNSMCYCEKGYARDNNDNCIPIKKCPPLRCKSNEIYEKCPDNLCKPLTCSEVGYPVDCSEDSNSKCPGKPGCICDNDEVRNSEGYCIPRDQCPSCGGDPNAVAGCGVNCGRLCSNYKNDNVVCPEICNLNGCDCKDGYVFDENLKKCVLPEDCTPTCDFPEQYSDCANGGCRKRKCSEPIICVDPISCQGGCICADGYTRAENNTCIPEEECPASCGGDPNAVAGCGINCGRLCSNYKNDNVVCPEICNLNGCDCKDGYVFDENLNKCVLPDDCTPTCDFPEQYSECANGGCRKRKCSEPIICVDPISCQGGCICADGYTRAENNTCIPEEECPELQCKSNEIYEKCPDNLCKPLTCSEVGYPVDCSEDSNSKCPGKPGCICDNDEVRNSEGYCIPRDQCPSCGGDPNAVAGCGVNCGRLCSNYKDDHVICPKICKVNGCDCKDGYVFDENLNKCVLPEDCTPTCDFHEHYSECANGGCRKRKCSEPIICVRPKSCKGGCICADGYTRGENNTCIAEEECPVQCNKPHEYYDSCAPTCPPQTCDSIGKIYFCPRQSIICKGACRCKKGYYRNNNGDCITEHKCKNTDPSDDGSTSLSTVNKTEAKERWDQAGIALSGEFIYQLSQSKRDQNFVTSATSILVLLAQLTLFAKNIVLQQLLTLFKMNNKDEIKAILPAEIESYKNQQLVIFDSASKCYANLNYQFTEKFIEDSKRYIDSEAENLDFAKNQEAANTINKWVSERTRDKIQNLISPDVLSADTVLVLVNAIYFLGNWVHQFNPNITEKRNFTKLNNDVVQLDTMCQKNTFNYAENSDKGIQALEMDYKGGNFSFFIILPCKDNFDATVQALRDPDEFIDIYNSLSYEQVNVCMPKLKIQTNMDMGEMLQKSNLTEMFKTNADGFEGILKNNQQLFVSAVVQKAFLEADEKGTEAAAATAAVVTTLSAVIPPPKIFTFNANHSFIFYIILDSIPIFCGVFVGAE